MQIIIYYINEIGFNQETNRFQQEKNVDVL